MTQREYLVRISDSQLPSGQIAAADFAALTSAMQLLATRVARAIGGSERPGRPSLLFEQASRVMVTGISSGSTVLAYRLGDSHALELAGGLDAQLHERFDEIVGGIASNTRPEWTTPLVADAARRLTDTIKTRFADGTVEVTTPERVVPIAPSQLDLAVWEMAKELLSQQVAITGTLYRVDVRSGSFRIGDDAGNDIQLLDVPDPEASGPLVGGKVTASGVGEYINGKLVGVVAPNITPLELPGAWTAPSTHERVVARGSFGDGIDGLSDQDVEEFLALL